MLRRVRYSLLFTCSAIVLASNYFAFQVELFDAEYEENHPTAPGTASGTCTITASSLTWESFDKDNAPQAFVVDACVTLACFHRLPEETALAAVIRPSFERIRDKSPPLPTAVTTALS
jgi:hypothetical protein